MSRYDPYWNLRISVSKLLALEDRSTIEHHVVSRSILTSLISMKFGLELMLESDIGAKVPSSRIESCRTDQVRPLSVLRILGGIE